MKVLLLAGGDSNERAVSLTSGYAIYESLERLGHKVFAIDPGSGKSLIASDGRFTDPELTNSTNGKQSAVARLDNRQLISTLSSPGFSDIEVVFLALHGGMGENGAIQCLLGLAGKRFTGSGMAASAIAMDKTVSKRIFSSVGLKTPSGLLLKLKEENLEDKLMKQVTDEFSFPFIVKPNDGGSTVGLSLVKENSQLRDALISACRESNQVLIEEYVSGRELTVAVLNGSALPVVEIRPKGELYDYEAKYTKGGSEYIAPADIDEELAQNLRDGAEAAYNAVGAWGLARVDYILDKNGVAFCLELNTLPGMTELSLAPMSARVAGIEFDDLVEQILNSAIDR